MRALTWVSLFCEPENRVKQREILTYFVRVYTSTNRDKLSEAGKNLHYDPAFPVAASGPGAPDAVAGDRVVTCDLDYGVLPVPVVYCHHG